MKVTKSVLNEIKRSARYYWLEGRQGLDDTELIVYSYLRAMEMILKLEGIEYDLPTKNEAINEED